MRRDLGGKGLLHSGGWKEGLLQGGAILAADSSVDGLGRRSGAVRGAAVGGSVIADNPKMLMMDVFAVLEHLQGRCHRAEVGRGGQWWRGHGDFQISGSNLDSEGRSGDRRRGEGQDRSSGAQPRLIFSRSRRP